MPIEPKPRKRRRKAGDLAALRRVMWAGLVAAEEILADPEAGNSDKLKAGHVFATLGGAYLRALEADDLIPRLEALEEAMKERA